MSDNTKSFSRQFLHPVTLISVSAADKENIATMAWVSAVSSSPPLLTVAVSPRRYTHDLLLESKEFGLMVLSDEQKQLSTLAGTTSGRRENKWDLEMFRSLRTAPQVISAPLLKECRSTLECKVVNSTTAGDHTIFIGEVILVNVNENKNPLLLFNRQYLKTGQFIANYP